MLISGFCAQGLASQAPTLSRLTRVKVEQVVSGDTFLVRGHQKVRYSGLMAPPSDHPKAQIREWAQKSLEFNRKGIEGKEVLLEWDHKLRDKDGAYLAYVFLEDGTFVNTQLLEAGMAKVLLQETSLSRLDELRESEKKGKRARGGVWQDKGGKSAQINNVIGDKTTKIFHDPHCRFIDQIRQVDQVEFKSRIEATAQGYKQDSACKAYQAISGDKNQRLWD